MGTEKWSTSLLKNLNLVSKDECEEQKNKISTSKQLEIDNLKKIIEEQEIKLNSKESEIVRLKNDITEKEMNIDNLNRASLKLFNQVDEIKIETIKKILPIYEDVFRSIEYHENSDFSDTNKELESMRKGIESIYHKFFKLLEDEGIAEVDVQGKPFDVEYSEAMLQIETDLIPEGYVTKVIERGFSLGEKIIKHSKVAVSKSK